MSTIVGVCLIFSLFKASIFCSPICDNNNGLDIPVSFIKDVYQTNISLGTPPQKFQVDIGSRSQQFWVRSTNCTLNCDRNPKYDSKSSSTHVKDGRLINATYSTITETMSGYLSMDTMTLNNGAIIDGVSFGEVQNIFPSLDISASLGFGFKVNYPFNFLIDDILRFTCIKKVAAFYLKRIKPADYDNYVADAGHITIGSLTGDANLYNGTIDWVKGHRTIDGDVKLGVESINLSNGLEVDNSYCDSGNNGSNGCQAIFDTTSFFIGLPGMASMDINQKLGFKPWIGTGFYTECKNLDIFPNVEFNLENGLKVSIPASDYLIQVGDDHQEMVIDGKDQVKDKKDGDEDGDKMCISKLFPTDGKDVVLGTPFLYNVYTLFDYDQKMFGFANYK